MQNLLTLLALLGKSFQLLGFDSLAVFGDSISDDGPDMMGVTHGFKKFCSGPNWVDFMGRNLGIKTENYAYSGAKSDYGNYYGYNWSGGLWQIERYLEEHDNQVPTNTLIVLQAMGINDFCQDQDNGRTPDPTKVAENFYQSLSKLADHGAKHILIYDILNLGPVPWVREREDYRKALNQFTESANILLAQKIQDLKASYPPTKFYVSDVEKVVTDIEKIEGLKMAKFDYHKQSTEPATAFDYAFFDSWHPGSVVHSHVALEGFRGLLLQVHGVTLMAPGASRGGSEVEPIGAAGDLFTRIRESIRRNRQMGSLQ